MADGYARFSGKIGLATTTQGPGYTNATTSVVLARLHRSPVLMLAGHASLRDPYNPQGEAEAAAWQGRLVRPSRGRDPGVDACERGHHARGDRRDHRFGPLRGCAGARSEAVPERSHLSGVHGAGRRQVLQGRETRPTAGAVTGGRAAGYLAAERCCVAAISAAAPAGISPRPVCHPLAVGLLLL